jgi:hypothetical protein
MVDDMELRPADMYAEDRLPWLETVEPDEPPHRPWGRILGGVILSLAAIAALIFGVQRLQQHGAGGNGELIAAQEGDYKVKPNDPGGLKVDGEGNAAIATSAGKNSGTGAIDLKAVPEAPVSGHHARPAPSAGTAAAGRNAVAQVPASGGRLVATAPVSVARPVAAGGGHGSLVQLGAFPTEGAANAAWNGFTKRFVYLAPLGKSVQSVAMGGKTLYRLRVNAGSADQAADICGRLKVAGEACFVAS